MRGPSLVRTRRGSDQGPHRRVRVDPSVSVAPSRKLPTKNQICTVDLAASPIMRHDINVIVEALDSWSEEDPMVMLQGLPRDYPGCQEGSVTCGSKLVPVHTGMDSLRDVSLLSLLLLRACTLETLDTGSSRLAMQGTGITVLAEACNLPWYR